MYCPRTEKPLTEFSINNISLFLAPTGGVFFDNRQIYHFSDPNIEQAQVLVRHLADLPSHQADLTARINCPKCRDIVMMRRFFTPVKAVEIDECPGCGGIWLDAGELKKIHINYLTPSERALLRSEMAANKGFVSITTPRPRRSLTLTDAAYKEPIIESLVELAITALRQ